MLTNKSRVNVDRRERRICGERVTVFDGRVGLTERDCIFGLGKYYDNYTGGNIA